MDVDLASDETSTRFSVRCRECGAEAVGSFESKRHDVLRCPMCDGPLVLAGRSVITRESWRIRRSCCSGHFAITETRDKTQASSRGTLQND